MQLLLMLLLLLLRYNLQTRATQDQTTATQETASPKEKK